MPYKFECRIMGETFSIETNHPRVRSISVALWENEEVRGYLERGGIRSRTELSEYLNEAWGYYDQLLEKTFPVVDDAPSEEVMKLRHPKKLPYFLRLYF